MAKKVLGIDLPFGTFEQLSLVPGTAQTLTSSYIRKGAIIVPEGGEVRYRCDTTTTTATVGMPLEDGATLILKDHTTLTRFSVIAVDSAVTLNVHHLG